MSEFTMKSIPPLVAGAILLACSAVASAQATLYGRENFRGRAIVVDQAASNLRGTTLDDRASSLSIRGGTWEACSEAYYRGNCVRLSPGDYPSLEAAGIGNAISSVREIAPPQVAVVTRPAHGVALFEGADFTGRSVPVDGYAGSLDAFNDRARSMIVYDGQWEVCEHDRFRGMCRVYGPGRYPTLGALSAEVSSLRPADSVAYTAPAPAPVPVYTPAPAYEPPRVVLYDGQNFRGRATAIGEDLIADFRGRGVDEGASSARVEGGTWLLCSDANFQGNCWTFGPGEYPVLPPSLTDRVESARRVDDSRGPNWNSPR